MNVFEKITHITFWTTLVFILSPLTLLLKPDLFDLVTSNNGINPYNLTLYVFNIGAFYFWVYCIWFWHKYDKYSLSIIPLIFFNVLYALIYYYRVKIIKRPLRNNKNRKQIEHNSDIKETESADNEITETEFIELTRQNIFNVIDLWSSKEIQLDYQKNEPIAQVSTELFCQWEDLYYPDSNDFKQAFDKEELEILKDFDKALNDTANKTPENPPIIDEFIKTQEWLVMNNKAIEIKKQLNTVGNNA